MRQALPDADVVGFEPLEAGFPKTDIKDRPVAAAAARCAPCSLVTWNMRDFDRPELAAHGVELTNPDWFLCRLFDSDADIVIAATQRAFGFLRRPNGRPNWDEYLDLHGLNNHLSKFASRLQNVRLEHDPAGADETEGDS
jgi:hypothetical protein